MKRTGRLGVLAMAGTLFVGSPTIAGAGNLQVAPLSIEMPAHGGTAVLYVTNHDKPGFVGRIGTTLAEAGVNIGTFHLGRQTAGGDAIALIRVDKPITDDLLARVRAIPNVVQVKSLRF